MKVKLLSRVQLLATSWTAAYQAPPSMGFSRQEYWSGVPLPSPLAVFCKSPLGSCKSRKPRALPDFHALFLFPSSVCSSSKLCCHNSVVRPLASENRIPQGRCHRFRIIRLSGENKVLKATLFSSVPESESESVGHSVGSDSLRPLGLQPTRLLSMGFSMQEYWSGLPFHPRGDHLNPGI